MSVAIKHQTPKSTSSRLVFWIVLSILSSVGIILINKTLFNTYNLKFVFSLTACHFLAQAIALEVVSKKLHLFEIRRIPMFENILTAIAGVASIAFMNFNLLNNSVGFYQMTKLLCIPFMVVVQTVFYGKYFSAKIKFSLLLVLSGVGIVFVTDLTVNTIGTIFGAAAVMSTTQYQIWQGAKREKHNVTPMQLTHSVSLPLFVITAGLALLLETGGEHSILTHEFSGPMEILLILTSCALAISVNLCSFTLIGISSPITYQVVGHFKTMLVFCGGFVLFGVEGDSWTLLRNLLGVFVAMFGVVLYGSLVHAEKNNIPDVFDKLRAKWGIGAGPLSPKYDKVAGDDKLGTKVV